MELANLPIAANGLPLVPFGSDMWDAVSKGREDFGKLKHFKACSNHFLEGKPTKCNPDPTLFLKCQQIHCQHQQS